MTAVEWLEDLYYPNYIPKEIFEQAKIMEKQQQGYSEQDMIDFAKFMLLENHEYKSYTDIFNEWFKQFKKI